ncbi:HTH-type transcriptional regulator XynR [Baekduia alba]|uniref:IclR family transcriptional regulator n=1 Tax=Baekduia alba TaxID=2997333 RepID=UPI002340E7D9|nr:IclR family transcriptional regulator [Baekduia alba]WCB95351.1 HTH-type transcriptional regulator XynR [Baekduia alba]
MAATSSAPVKSADRVLAVLDLLAEAGPLRFAELCAALGLPKSSTHGLVATMSARGYLRRDREGRFALGLRVWEIAQSADGIADLRAVLQPLMAALRTRTEETVQAAQLDGVDAVYLNVCESPHPMKLSSRVGSRLPAYASGLGKTLLAGLDPDDARARLAVVERRPLTPRTVVELDTLMEDLDVIRARGFGTDDEEFAIGLRCVAMPIRDADGEVVAAMSVSIPTPRWTKAIGASARRALAETVAEAARRLAIPH